MSASQARRPARRPSPPAPEIEAPAPPSGSRRFAIALFLGAVLVAAASFYFFAREGNLDMGVGSGGDDREASALLAKGGDIPTVKDLNELRATYGDPADATYGRIRIDAIGVDAPIGVRVVGDDGAMPDPTGPSDVVWYDFQNMPGFGGLPGNGNNAIFAAHVDRAAYLDYAGVNYIGPGVFYSLGDLSSGDIIELDIGAETLYYMVAWAQDVSIDADWGDYMTSDVDYDSITLITCGGEFDAETHGYTKRTLVRATRA